MTNDRKIRLEQIYKRLGSRTPSCVVCGYDDPFALELHHIAGRKHGDELAIVCRNCHRRLSEDQAVVRHLPPAAHESERLGHFLRGLADLLVMIAERLRSFAEQLLGLETEETSHV